MRRIQSCRTKGTVLLLTSTLAASCASAPTNEGLQAVTIHGIELVDRELGGELALLSCWCVSDSPENPCSCHGPAVRIPRSQLFQFGPSNRQSTEGQTLSAVTLPRSAPIIAGQDESPVSVGLFLERSNTVLRVKTGFLKGGGAQGTAGAILGAFLVGWELGKKIDQETGLSTKLGDFLWDLTKKLKF